MIIRPKPLKKSRYKKIRLDKNEKNDDFKIEFLNSFKKIIKNKNNKKLLSRLSDSKKVRKQIIQLKQDVAKPDFGRE